MVIMKLEIRFEIGYFWYFTSGSGFLWYRQVSIGESAFILGHNFGFAEDWRRRVILKIDLRDYKETQSPISDFSFFSFLTYLFLQYFLPLS